MMNEVFIELLENVKGDGNMKLEKRKEESRKRKKFD